MPSFTLVLSFRGEPVLQAPRFKSLSASEPAIVDHPVQIGSTVTNDAQHDADRFERVDVSVDMLGDRRCQVICDPIFGGGEEFDRTLSARRSRSASTL